VNEQRECGDPSPDVSVFYSANCLFTDSAGDGLPIKSGMTIHVSSVVLYSDTVFLFDNACAGLPRRLRLLAKTVWEFNVILYSFLNPDI